MALNFRGEKCEHFYAHPRGLAGFAGASEILSTPVALRHACRSPRVLRTHCHAYARRIYVTAFRTCIGLSIARPADPTVPPLSASCSSRQRFASGFLPTPSRPGRRCLPLTLAHVGCVEDFHLPVSAPCRTHRASAEMHCGISAWGLRAAVARVKSGRLAGIPTVGSGVPCVLISIVVHPTPLARASGQYVEVYESVPAPPRSGRVSYLH